ncbi:hypothetical protein RFI_35724, partial [Reticulomyxa filosa]
EEEEEDDKEEEEHVDDWKDMLEGRKELTIESLPLDQLSKESLILLLKKLDGENKKMQAHVHTSATTTTTTTTTNTAAAANTANVTTTTITTATNTTTTPTVDSVPAPALKLVTSVHTPKRSLLSNKEEEKEEEEEEEEHTRDNYHEHETEELPLIINVASDKQSVPVLENKTQSFENDHILGQHVIDSGNHRAHVYRCRGYFCCSKNQRCVIL